MKDTTKYRIRVWVDSRAFISVPVIEVESAWRANDVMMGILDHGCLYRRDGISERVSPHAIFSVTCEPSLPPEYDYGAP